MTKLIQNLTQSHEIRFGDALEEVFTKYLALMGFHNLPTRLANTLSGDVLNVDQLFENDSTIYMIEQKVRDDHDSTKKRGQFTNFESKYFEIVRAYPSKVVVPLMWFIDSSLMKNKNYYIAEMTKMNLSHACNAKLCYGKELLDGNTIKSLDDRVWVEILEHLKQWKELLPDMPEINFDNESNEVFKEIKDLNPSIFRQLFQNDEIRKQILPILFPNGETFGRLKSYFNKNATLPIYRALIVKIDDFLMTNN